MVKLTRKEFESISEQFIEEMKRKLIVKNREYAPADEPLHNFYKSAEILRCTPKEAALAFATKHITSVIDLCKAGYPSSNEMWLEKLSDLAVYCALIYNMAIEENINNERGDK